jgi:hypothetical protein
MSESKSLPGFLIRRATVDESLMIASILRQAFVEYEPLYTPAAYAATTPTFDQIERRWDEGPHELFGTPLFTMVKQLQPTSSVPQNQASHLTPDEENDLYDHSR